MDKLTSMKVFTVVANAGSMSAAAEELDLSKAMVSKHMTYLEELLGCQLLHRSSRGIKLTELGEFYRNRCKQLILQIDETELLISRRNMQPTGTLKISAPTYFGTIHLLPKITNYQKMYPDVNIELRLNDRIVDLVEEGFDLAIRVGKLNDSSLIARKLTETRLVVCAAPDYLQQQGIPRSPADLVRHNCLIYKPSTARDEWIFKGVEGEFKQPVTGDLVANTGEALQQAAIRGRGLVQLANYLVGPDIEAGRLTSVLDDFQPDAIPVYAVFPERKNLSATVRIFVDYLRSCYQPAPRME